MALIIEGGISIGGSIAITSEGIPPTVPTNQYWLFDSNYVGNNLALGQPGAWNDSNLNIPPFLEAYATNPEENIVLGVLNGDQSLFTYSPKVMFSFYIATEDPGDVPLNLAAVGIAYQAVDLNAPLGIDANGVGWRQDGTVVYDNSTIHTGLPTFGPGDYLDVAVDLNTSTMWVRVNGELWNGNPLADPATGAGGLYIVIDGTGVAGTPTAVYPAVNPGAQNYVDAIDISLYTYSIPATFTAI